MSEKPQKMVFVLGAGASRASDFEFPVMKGFLAEISDDVGNHRELCAYLKDTFPKTPFSATNLEEVFTQIELDIEGLASIQALPLERLLRARSQLLDYVRRRLDIGNVPANVCSKHQKLLGEALASPSRVSILTLNYDLVVDATLRHPEVEDLGLLHTSLVILNPPGWDHFQSPSVDPDYRVIGHYLKLHGSLDWLSCPNEVCMNHQVFFPNALGEHTGQRFQAGDPCSQCGTNLEWVLIPPTMKKSFEAFPKLGLIWRLAHEELKNADRVLFFGVSMAESDYYLHWLIRSSLVYRDPKPGVVVINPCSEALDRTSSLTGVVPRHYEIVDEYLDKRDS